MIKIFYLIIMIIPATFSDTYAKEKIIQENSYSCSTQDEIEFCIDAENKPLSGKLEQLDKDGNVILRSYYKNGYKEGITTEYNEGKIFRKSYYKKGLKNGEDKEFFKNNIINISANYKDGMLSGSVERYNEEGDLIGRFRYKDGYLVKGFCQFKKGKNKIKQEITGSAYNQIINCED